MRTFLQAPICVYTGSIPTGIGGDINYSGLWAQSRIIWARNANFSHNYGISSQNKAFQPNTNNQKSNMESNVEFEFCPISGDIFLTYLTGQASFELNVAGVHLGDCYLNSIETSLSPQSPILFKASVSSFGTKADYNLTSGSFFQESEIEQLSSSFASITGHGTFPASGVPTAFSYRVECRRSPYYPSDSLFPESVTLDSVNIKVNSECLPDDFNNFITYSGATGAVSLSIKNQLGVEMFNLRASGIMASHDESFDTDRLPIIKTSIEENRF